MRRDLPKIDAATEQNLRTLESLADQDGTPGDFELIHSMVVSSIDIMKMLPSAVARHFDQGAFMIGASHDRVSAQRRADIWRGLAGKLAMGLDRVADDPELRDAPTKDMERPQTVGERLSELCHEAAAALSGSGDINSIVVKIEAEAVGTAASSDARAMRRLLDMKRIPDLDRWRSDFHYAIAHARAVAWQLHSQPARAPSR